MKDETDNGKSCDPQLFANGEPSNEWGLEELGVYAKMQYDHILSGEKLLTPAYWRLGHALELAKQAFRHGKWAQYLKDRGIDKTRASKARSIYRTFDRPEEVAELTIEEAYAKRQRQRSQSAEPKDGSAHAPKDVQRLRKSISSISKRTGDVIHDAAFAEPGEAVILIPAVRKAISELQELLKCLEQQAGSRQPNDDVG